jgi:DNA-binding transcriptional LysR family regulator
MDLRLLRSFVAVAEELHFGRAAKRLHISQPPLSMHIRRLEEELGVRVFERSRRGVSLTEAGSALLARAPHLLGEVERARLEVQRVGKGESGALAVGYTPTAAYELLPRLVPMHQRRFPDTRVELVELRSPLLPEALRSGRVELGFACAPVDTRGLVERALVRERLLVALPKAHALARRRGVQARSLIGEPFVLVRRSVEPGWADSVASALREHGLEPTVAQETDTKLAMLGLVAAGVGVSIVSESMQSLARRGVVFRPLLGVSLRLTLALLSLERVSARAAGFIACAEAAWPGAGHARRALNT